MSTRKTGVRRSAVNLLPTDLLFLLCALACAAVGQQSVPLSRRIDRQCDQRPFLQ